MRRERFWGRLVRLLATSHSDIPIADIFFCGEPCNKWIELEREMRKLVELGANIFRNEIDFVIWLEAPKVGLKFVTPLRVMNTTQGCGEVMTLLNEFQSSAKAAETKGVVESAT